MEDVLVLLIKFNKSGVFTYNSYLNCRDVINQTLKRAKINISYSQGFNPHELLYFSPPTSLGIQSQCEYMYIITDYTDTQNFKISFNKKVPSGLELSLVKLIEQKPNFYDLIDYAQYEFATTTKFDAQLLEVIKEQSEFSNKIYSIHAKDDNILQCTIACGQKANLKPSKIADIIHQYGYEIKSINKIALYKKVNDNLVDIDSLLFN